MTGPVPVGGPYYEDLRRGQVFDVAPSVTLTAGQAAVHQAILGDRLRLPLDAVLSARVLGRPGQLAHPGLVCDVAIGQSTHVTQRVIGNLFYRGLVLRRAPVVGDTLSTTTEVVALRDTSRREGRAPAGLAALRMRTVDQDDRVVLDFHRCAMLPMRGEGSRPGHGDDLDAISSVLPGPEDLAGAVAGWDLGAYRESVPGAHAAELVPGAEYEVLDGETVSAAPELARLTLNIAAVHTDPASAAGRGQRLVYGGHTIGIALSHAARALPNLVTVVAWRTCDHLGPVREGDVLRSRVAIGEIAPIAAGGALADLRVLTSADRMDAPPAPVLDWSLVALFA
ncbi:MAG TPA: MaoC family dehydratase [Solirubrobacteraceae bacterium]|nr:MaoC family dehydratase [Solirubrobacteraceae bacterium]